MKKLLQMTGVLVLTFSTSNAIAQPTPLVTGEDTICPGSTTTWSCDAPYESYQWYQRYYGSNDTFPVSGATLETLTMDYYDVAGSYLIVEATENGDTVMSPEFYVEGWVFASITTSAGGEFTTGNQGQMILCEGDTIYLSINLPYVNSVVWYDNFNTISGETDDTLIVTGAGSFTVSGSPEECPDFVQTQWISMDVEVHNCGSAGLDENTLQSASIYPNPATEQITVSHPSELIEKIEIRNTAGQLVRITTVNQLSTTLSVDNLRKGTYFITVNYSDRYEVLPVTIQ
jgi:hypothetical protein